MKSSKVGSPQIAPLSKHQQLQQQVDQPDAGALEDPVFAAPFYEPTSVLDPHLSSSPAASDPLLLLDIPAPPHSCWDDPPLSSSSSDDWDPVTWFLGGGGGGGEQDDPALPPPFKPFHQFLDNNSLASNEGSTLPPFPFSDAFSPAPVDLERRPCFDPAASVLPPPPVSDGSSFDDVHLIQLIQAAQALESNDLSHANLILARLNQPLAAPTGRPVQRAACYFREALQSILDASGQQHHHHYSRVAENHLSPVELVHKIIAYKGLSDISPVPQFASFTANQMVLEAVEGSRSIHLIDFDIGLGGQWSSFLHEVAERCRAARAAPPSVRMTAIVAEESLETRLSAENLRDFARGVGLAFSIELIRVDLLGVSALGPIRLSAGDSVAVSFTPASFRLFGNTLDSVVRFLRFIRHVSPRVAVFVDTESSCRFSSSPAYLGQPQPQQQLSFRRGFTAGLEHYSVLMASLDAAAAAIGYGDDQVWRIERLLIRPRVLASVAASLSCGASLQLREMFEAAGMKPIPFSEFTESQAEWLTRHAPVGGFQVARREWSMVLSWQGKDLATTSAWRV